MAQLSVAVVQQDQIRYKTAAAPIPVGLQRCSANSKPASAPIRSSTMGKSPEIAYGQRPD